MMNKEDPQGVVKNIFRIIRSSKRVTDVFRLSRGKRLKGIPSCLPGLSAEL